MEDMMRRALPIALLQMMLVGILMALCLQNALNFLPPAHAQPLASLRNIPGDSLIGQVGQSGQDQKVSYGYYTLKQSGGFVLARAPKGPDGQPLQTPVPIAHFTNDFGLAESDNVLSMQLSPDGRFLAIDGTHDYGEQVWIYDIQRGTLTLTPPNVLGNFLHWLPGSTSHVFLYRPMFPMGPSAPMDGGGWNPGLWEVDAATGAHKNFDIGMSSAFLIDAAPSPDGTHIVYSTTLGLSRGSDTWLMNSNGSDRTHLFSVTNGAQSIAGFFTWSPDGTMLAYERLSDSPVPFLPASLWVMNTGEWNQQRYLADVDGGHGYAPLWSPDGSKIVFVKRTNVGDRVGDTNVQGLQSAIAVVDVATGQSWDLASPSQTGMSINANPVWAEGSNSITFTAFNPINRVIGGTPRYWSVSVVGPNVPSALIPLTPALAGVVAME
jgi:Tol biopolymer transport system component